MSAFLHHAITVKDLLIVGVIGAAVAAVLSGLMWFLVQLGSDR